MNRELLSSGMRKLIALLILVIALGASTAWLEASPLDDKVAALKKAMKEEIADKQSKGTAPGAQYAPGNALLRNPGVAEMLMANLKDVNGDYNAPEVLQQVLAQFSSDAVQQAGQDLMDEIRAERRAKTDAYLSSVNDLIKSAPNIVLKAAKPSDLDQLLVDLQKLAQAGQGNSGMDQEMQRASQRALSTYQFVAGWQDYLSDSENGRNEQAVNELRSLSQNNNGESLIPRSQILDRIGQLTPGATKSTGGAQGSPSMTAKEIAAGIQSLDDMAPTLQRIRALPPVQEDDGRGGIAQGLERFVTQYDYAKAGLPVQFNFGFPIFQPQFDNPKLFTKLWLFCLEREFDTFKGPPPAEDESALQYLGRVFADAEQREDWHELQKAYLAYAYIERNSLFSTGNSPHDTTGFESMLAGINQETAGQYAPAVVSYEQALKFPNTYLPAKFIGDRLDKIQKDHPDDYAKGLQLAGLALTATAPTNTGVPLSPH